MTHSGTADLPLHSGRVPPWLAQRMSSLGLAMTEIILAEEGTEGFLKKLSDPHWFQAFGCALGMDWHSSGITTSVMGALKRAVNPLSKELGLYIAGGRGKYSRGTPDELRTYSEDYSLDAEALVQASRLTAKVDNTCLQDSFQIYLHTFVITQEGEWAVIQQGMNTDSKLARRYHWTSESAGSYLDDPQAAVVGRNQGELLNFSDSRSASARGSLMEFFREKPQAQMREIARLVMPSHHEVTAKDVSSSRLGGVLAAAYTLGSSDFKDVLLLKGVGPRTLQSLSLVSEVLYGEKTRFTDPARFAFAHGGKDGHPAPVPLHVYDQSIRQVQSALEKAKAGNSDKLAGIKALSTLSRQLEEAGAEADVDKVIEFERSVAPLYGGRTVFDDVAEGKSPPWKDPYAEGGKKGRKKPKEDFGQLELF